jgi:hypothetical protein
MRFLRISCGIFPDHFVDDRCLPTTIVGETIAGNERLAKLT